MRRNTERNLQTCFLRFCLSSIVACLLVLMIMVGSSPASAQGSILYGAAHTSPSGPSTLYIIDPATGIATEAGPIGFNHCGGLDFDRFGMLYGTALREGGGETSVLIRINPASGVGTEVGPTGFPAQVNDISFRNSDGVLYVSFLVWEIENCIHLGRINTQTGAGMTVGSTLTCNPGNGIAFSPSDTLYHAQMVDETENGSLYILGQGTGVATLATPLVFPEGIEFPRINAMDFHPDTGILYASLTTEGGIGYPNYLATVDTTTGQVSIIGETVDGLAALTFYSSVIVGGMVEGEGWSEILVPWFAFIAVIVVGMSIFSHRRARA